MKLPKEFTFKKSHCKALTNEKGLLSTLPPIASTISTYHYSLACLMSGVKPISMYSTTSYFYCPNKLMNNVKLQILATHMKVKTILIDKDQRYGTNMICYIDPKYEENAYLCAYITKLIFHDVSANKQQKMISFNQAYNHILGTLYGYTEPEIRGYYLQRYLLKSLPPKIKSKMMKYVSNSNFDLDIVSYKTKLERLYKALKKVDNLADFDSKYSRIIEQSQYIIDDIKKSKGFKSFVKKTKPKLFKFDISELKESYPDEYDTYAPKLKKFEKSLK